MNSVVHCACSAVFTEQHSCSMPAPCEEQEDFFKQPFCTAIFPAVHYYPLLNNNNNKNIIFLVCESFG